MLAFEFGPPHSPYRFVSVEYRGEGVPRGLIASLPQTVLPALLVLCAALLCLGPVVSRIRELTRRVREVEECSMGGGDEIAELGVAFDEARRKVEQQGATIARRERALRSLVENVSHDVAMPLTVLRGHLSEIEECAALGERGGEALRAAMSEADYIAHLLANQGAVGRLEADAGALHLSRVDLREIVERAALRGQHLAQRRGLELIHAVPPEAVLAEIDWTLVERAVSNLVQNAVRYGKEGGHVLVNLLREGGRFELSVQDDGPGVEPTLLSRLAERHFRVEAARASFDAGLGLGLSIARDVATRHGFELCLRNRREGGFEARIQGLCAPEPPCPKPRRRGGQECVEAPESAGIGPILGKNGDSRLLG